MDHRFLLSFGVFGVASLMVGVGVNTLLSDTATSVDNLFSIGVVDLLLNNQQSIGAFITGTNLRPGDLVEGQVTLKNNGTLTGSLVDLDIALAVNNTNGYGYGLEVVASYLRITNLTYGGGANVTMADKNGNGYVDLDDWDRDNAATRDLADPGGSALLMLKVQLDANAPGGLQGGMAHATFTFYLAETALGDLPS